MDKEYQLGEIIKEWCEKLGWDYIPEYEGWDAVVFIRNISFGIQYKLKINVKALEQTILANSVDFKILGYDAKDNNADRWYVILMALKIIPLAISQENIKIVFQNISKGNWLLKYRQKNKNGLKNPELKVDIKSGAKAPLRVTDYNIAMCKLEKLYYTQRYITYWDCRDLGLDKIPKLYFQWNDGGKYILNMRNKPSEKFPHIWKALGT